MLAFLWSRTQTVDEIKDYVRYTSITWTDMIEALGRVADMKSLPARGDLEAAGYANILLWSVDKERVEAPREASSKIGTAASAQLPQAVLPPGEDEEEEEDEEEDGGIRLNIFRPRDSAGMSARGRLRPLSEKLEVLLDLVFRRLYWDPNGPEQAFSYDGLLKIVKKMDKDLGP